MKKFNRFALIISLLFCLLLAVTSCGDDESTGSSSETGSSVHFHTFDTKSWTITKDGHYNPCTCHPEIINLKNHVDLVDRNGICDVCGFVLVAADTYTVTVIDSEGAPVKGATIVFRSTKNDVTVKTDEKGQASAEFTDVSGVNAWLYSLPEGYSLQDRDIFPFKGFELTVTVNKN